MAGVDVVTNAPFKSVNVFAGCWPFHCVSDFVIDYRRFVQALIACGVVTHRGNMINLFVVSNCVKMQQLWMQLRITYETPPLNGSSET